MNFQVPQFIEIEDKVIGPLSFKQFIYIAGSIGLAFICYTFLPIYLALIPIGAIIALGLALAFYQVNNRPFIIVFQSALRYYMNNKLYLWHQRSNQAVLTTQDPTGGNTSSFAPPKLSQSKLAELSWNLDVKEKIQ